MENCILSSIDYELNLPEGWEIKTALVRGERLWGILRSVSKNRVPFFADLLVKPRPLVKIFNDIDHCLFIYVSNDGQFCLIRKTDELFCISTSDFKPFKITMIPGTKVSAVTFFKDELLPKPFIIIINDLYQVGLVNLNKPLSKDKFNILPFMIAQNKSIKDLSVVKFKDGYYCFSIIYQDEITPYIFDSSFLSDNCSAPSYCTQVGFISTFFSEKNYIGWVSQFQNSQQQLAFEYIIDTQRDHPRPEKVYSCQIAYNLPAGGTNDISFFNEFFFHFQPNGRVNIFINSMPDFIDGFTVKDATQLDFDTDESELYAIYPRRISNIKFESSSKNNFKGTDSLRYWLYNRSLARKDEKTAAKLICNMASLSMNGIFHFVRPTTTLRFYVYKHILKILRKHHPTQKGQVGFQSGVTKQKLALAYATYDLYTRIEMSKKKPDLIKYTEFTKQLINEGLLNMDTVKKTLDEYGWDLPYIRLSEPLLVFDRLMERNEKKKALQLLPQISNKDERFSNALLRVFPFSKETVVKIVSKLDSFDNSNFVPILMDKLSEPFVSKLLSKNFQMNSWVAKLYTIVAARNEKLRRSDVEQLFKQFQYSNDGIVQFIIREFFSLKKFALLTYGLISIKQYVTASSVAVKSKDCLRLVDSIFPINSNQQTSSTPTSSTSNMDGTVDLSQQNAFEMDNETKMRCIYAILRSVPPEKAGVLAKNLIYRLTYDKSNADSTLAESSSDNSDAFDSRKGMDSTILMLMNFLPYDTKINDLTIPISEFTKQKTHETKEQEKNKNEALAEIDKVSALLNDQLKDDNTIILHSTEVCEKCKKPFFGEPGIIYPCSHMLHVRCAKQLIMGIDGIENEINLDMDFDDSDSNDSDTFPPSASDKFNQIAKKVRINLPKKNYSSYNIMTINSNKSKDQEKKLVDYKSDCPLCGYLSVRLMNEPFRGNLITSNIQLSGEKKDIDPFTTDIAQLTAIVNSGKKTSFFNI